MPVPNFSREGVINSITHQSGISARFCDDVPAFAPMGVFSSISELPGAPALRGADVEYFRSIGLSVDLLKIALKSPI